MRQEVDYLAGAQLAVDPDSFSEAVKEAYLLEHGCREQQDIAQVLGVDKSRVSQIFHHPERLKAESVRELLAPLKRERHRRRILRAWLKESLGVDIEARPRGPLLAGSVSERTLRRVDRMIRQSRWASAARLSLEAAGKTKDLELKEALLDRAFFSRVRLDLPDQAMGVAREIAEGAAARRDYHRLATASFLGARALMALGDTTPEEIEDWLGRAESLLAAPALPSAKFLRVTPAALRQFRLGAQVSFIERGRLFADEATLRALVNEILAALKRPRLPFQTRSTLHLLSARLFLLLGDTFAAQEHVDRSFQAGELKNLNIMEFCALVQGRILAQTEEPRIVRDHFKTVSSNCLQAFDLYRMRMAEAELARAEGRLFPGTLPPDHSPD